MTGRPPLHLHTQDKMSMRPSTSREPLARINEYAQQLRVQDAEADFFQQ